MRWRVLVGAMVLAACSSTPAAPDRPSPSTAPPDPGADGVVRLLFLGNSHTSHHDVPGTVAALLRAARPVVRVVAVREPTIQHLQERAAHRPTLALLASQPWDYVVLQAQDYSLSGRTSYPTDGAESLARRARRQGAHVVLFAEWARRDVDETQLILDTYGHVAAAGPACLPPVPEAFDRAAPLHLELLAPDGNHSSPDGAFLASAVLAGALLHRPLAGLPAVRTPDAGAADGAAGGAPDGVPDAVQRRLRKVADAALAALPPGRRCPRVSR